MEENKILDMLMALSQRIAEIQADIKVIRHDLDSDYKVLHGNGHEGLLDRVAAIEKKLAEKQGAVRIVREWAGWLFAAINLWLGYKMMK